MKKRSVSWAIAIFGLVLTSTLPLFGLDQVEYQALLEKEKITMGEKVQYLVRVNYATTTMKPAITPPTFAQFTVLNEHESVKEVGSGEERYKVFRKVWLLEPNEPGHLSIASAIVTYQDPTSNLLKNGKTDILFIEVAPSPGSEAKVLVTPTAIPDSTSETRPGGKPWPWWAGGIVGLVLLLIVVIIISKRSSLNTQLEDAAELNLQKAIGLAEQDDLDGYYQLLSHTFLDYLQEKFNINAHADASDKILEQLKQRGVEASILNELADYFKAADQVKFGGYSPNEDELIKIHGAITRFIQAGKSIKVKRKK